MRRVSEVGAQFAKMLDAVAAGETLVVTRYGEPVAWLERAVRAGAAQTVHDLPDDERG